VSAATNQTILPVDMRRDRITAVLSCPWRDVP